MTQQCDGEEEGSVFIPPSSPSTEIEAVITVSVCVSVCSSESHPYSSGSLFMFPSESVVLGGLEVGVDLSHRHTQSGAAMMLHPLYSI